MDRFPAEALSAFAVFAELRNFTRAAERLHLSQPALHVKIGKLAQAVGRPLYRRHGRQLQLTDEGHALARFARSRDEELTAFLAELLGGTATTPVVLAAGQGAFLYLLGDAIGQVLAGGGRLNLVTARRTQALAAVRSGAAHLGVAVLDVRPDDLVTVPLARYPQCLAMRADHPLAARRTVALSDLDGVPLVVPPADRPLRALLERSVAAAGAAFTVAVEADGWPLMLHFAQLGIGAAVVNSCVTIPDGMVSRPIPALPRAPYYALHQPGALDDARVADLLAAVTAHLR